MAVRIPGQENPHKQEIKEQLRQGVKPEELATKFTVHIRTLYHWLKEIQDEKAGKVPASKKVTAQVNAGLSPGVSKEAFTPIGAANPAPPGSPTQEYINFGTFRLPLEDWGYSSAKNMLIVATTYDDIKREYGLPKSMKVGDVQAELCQAFRLMKGWDVIGGGLPETKEVGKNG
jgi:hypothetical protein